MAAKKRTAPGRDPLELMDEWFPPDAEDIKLREAALARMRVAQVVSEARRAAGVTQEQLARMIGTKRSAIGRLESPKYHSHSIPMLQKVASALGKQVIVMIVDPEDANCITYRRKTKGPRRPRRVRPHTAKAQQERVKV